METRPYEVADPRDYIYLGEEMDNRDRPFNGSTKLITSLLALLNLLMAAGIVGIIVMYGKVAAFEVRFQDLDQKVDMIVEGRIRIPDGGRGS
jgi:hypothetical protein